MAILKDEIRFTPTDSNARLPTKGTPGAAGWDLYAVEAVSLAPGEHKLVSTGLNIALPTGLEGQVRPRSGLALKKGVTVLNAPGTIDEDYRGPLGVILINLSQEWVTIHAEDRIAQIVFQPVLKAIRMRMVDELDETERGVAGFGSTGT